jgi:hypothetical protein
VVSGVFRRTIRPFGARFTITSDDDRMWRACAAAVARFPTSAGAVGNFSLDVSTVADSIVDPAWPETTLDTRPTGITIRCGGAVLELDHRSRHAALSIPAALWRVDDAVRMFVEGVVSSMLIGTGQLHAIHSGLVVRAGRGVMLRGPSGAGKSTTTYACLRAGFAMASDDWIYAIAGRSPDRLYGYPWRMFLVPDAPQHFPELASVGPVPHPGSDRSKLPIEPPVHRRRLSATVDAVVFLDPATGLAIRPISTTEAQERFWSSALPTEQRDLPAAWIGQLLERPCFVLQRGTSPVDAASLLTAMVSRLE